MLDHQFSLPPDARPGHNARSVNLYPVQNNERAVIDMLSLGLLPREVCAHTGMWPDTVKRIYDKHVDRIEDKRAQLRGKRLDNAPSGKRTILHRADNLFAGQCARFVVEGDAVTVMVAEQRMQLKQSDIPALVAELIELAGACAR